MTHRTVHGPKKRVLAVGLATVLLLSAVTAVSTQAADISVSNATAHVMEDSVNGRRIEVYMTIENSGAARDRLYAVRSKLSRKTMISATHHTGHGANGSGQDGMAHSDVDRHMETSVLDVAAGGVASLRHGDSHIMLMDPKETPAVGATFPITLFFERAGRVSVEVTVEPIEMGH
jgi:copper(I)-binding protein